MGRYRAVCCDLLTALLDSWSLWESVAGDAASGTRWRLASLELVTRSGTYRAYDAVVAEAAIATGVDPEKADELLRRWRSLMPFADVRPALSEIDLPIVVVTNTSQRLAELAAAKLEVPLLAVVSAETAGWYKPAVQAYQAGWRAAGAASAAECLFVAGSPHDASGATAAGHDVFWVNRRSAALPAGGPEPRWTAPNLERLSQVLEPAG